MTVTGRTLLAPGIPRHAPGEVIQHRVWCANSENGPWAKFARPGDLALDDDHYPQHLVTDDDGRFRWDPHEFLDFYESTREYGAYVTVIQRAEKTGKLFFLIGDPE